MAEVDNFSKNYDKEYQRYRKLTSDLQVRQTSVSLKLFCLSILWTTELLPALSNTTHGQYLDGYTESILLFSLVAEVAEEFI